MWGSNLHSYRRRQSWHQTLYICSLCTKIVKDYLSEKGEWLRSEGLECVQKLVSVHAFGGLHRNHLQPRNTRIAWIVATWPMETGVPQPGRYDRRLETTMAVAKAPWRETRRNSSFHIEWKTKHGFSSKYCRILEALQMDFQDVWRGRRLRTWFYLLCCCSPRRPHEMIKGYRMSCVFLILLRPQLAPTLLWTCKDHRTTEEFGSNAFVTRVEIFDISIKTL